MSPLRLPWLEDDPDAPFPPPETALREPDGLLAAGGDLSPRRLLAAYRQGIFPWFSAGEPPLWWSPDPRAVFRTGRVARSRRFRRSLRGSTWVARADTAFDQVIATCARIPRRGQRGTWITDDMLRAYSTLHRLGHAHSVEVYDGTDLVGAIYGVAIGRMFFGESMFSARTDGSKVAIAALAQVLAGWGWPLIDAQVANPHLALLGAELWPRGEFLREVARLTAEPGRVGSWTAAVGELPASSLAAAD
ncbi:leucyl/phenylalanyl-tRNA--protein transferase [Lysobacter sp. N42]|uniref:leucyl/phenylalanyl-tRNA--protein transferase n=1 Tax=Lysobacter sp. N42 TaxID=2545719 RepID=UPI0010530431|nr:leucyl/phenylalanyl-tRNA--protein transferase [Lysobacter sp. N42]TCZ88347.1 leucyl/phenylalanyl-tRNA--protein transferase [Lysobacter sp. N42]